MHCRPRVLLACALLASACGSAQPTTSPDTSTFASAESDEPATTVQPDSETTDSETTDSGATATQAPPLRPFVGRYVPRVIATHPHDPSAYTQGLELYGQHLVESVGRTGSSDRRIVDIASGAILTQARVTDEVFAEGITVVGDELVQLTWTSEVVIRSDATTLEETGRSTYTGEGWGICFDGNRLVMSNGSAELTFRDPATFAADATVTVRRDDGTPVALLNELECVNGQVFANIYTSDEIIVIDPATGEVTASIDAAGLRPDGAPADDANYALNGIAFDPAAGTFYLTGKWWPVLYEVEFVPA